MPTLKFKASTAAAIISLLSPFFIAQPAIATTSPELDFIAGQDIGVNATTGFTYTYTNVGTVGGSAVDARVSIMNAVNLDSDDDESDGADLLLDELDERDSSNATINKQLEVGIDIFGSNALETGYVDIRFEFFYTGTTNPITISNLVFHVKDIDSRQFLEVYNPTSYALTQDTDLVVLRTADDATIPLNGVRFDEPLGSSSNSSDEDHWAEVRYSAANIVEFRLGAKESGGASFGVSFRSAGFTSPIALVQSTIIYDIPLEKVVMKVAPKAVSSVLAKPIGKCGISLSFKRPSSLGTGSLAGYEIFRNGMKLTQVSANSPKFIDRCVEQGQSFSYQVITVTSDGKSIRSRSSNSIIRGR